MAPRTIILPTTSTVTHGTNWQYALVIGAQPGNADSSYPGAVYAVNDNQVITSYYPYPGQSWATIRDGEPVQYSTTKYRDGSGWKIFDTHTRPDL